MGINPHPLNLNSRFIRFQLATRIHLIRYRYFMRGRPLPFEYKLYLPLI